MGAILGLSSLMSQMALPESVPYPVSKSGLLGFSKSFPLQLAPEKITVNGIGPCPFAMGLNKPLMKNAALDADFLAKIPLGM